MHNALSNQYEVSKKPTKENQKKTLIKNSFLLTIEKLILI